MLPLQKITDRVFVIPDFLTSGECLQLIDLSEAKGFAAADVRTHGGLRSMPRIRNNDRVMVDAGTWRSTLWDRLSEVELPSLDGQSAAGLPRDLRFYRYAPGQRFKMHKDGPWTEEGLTSKLTFLVYLNRGFTGGQTDFRDHVIEPCTGTALLFVHDTWHEGAEVTAGVKYILRSDVLYA